MKKTIAVICFLAAGLACAGEESDEETETASQVDLRVSVIENIEVTSDKAPSQDAEELHPDIEAILEEADAIEEDLEHE